MISTPPIQSNADQNVCHLFNARHFVSQGGSGGKIWGTGTSVKAGRERIPWTLCQVQQWMPVILLQTLPGRSGWFVLAKAATHCAASPERSGCDWPGRSFYGRAGCNGMCLRQRTRNRRFDSSDDRDLWQDWPSSLEGRIKSCGAPQIKRLETLLPPIFYGPVC